MSQNSPQTTSRPAPQCTVPEGEPVPIIKGSHVYLIDGSGYIFRAFHALPPLTRPSDGMPVGAVHGFCAMLWKLLVETKASEAPTHLAVVFDASEKTFRNDIYQDYKAHRPPAPEELVPQFPLIREAVRAFNVACLEQLGYEADDLIATYAKEVVEKGGDVTIVSSDKDLMQLVRPGVVMWDGMKNKKIDRDEVFARFGVAPDKVVDVQALAGDSTDNVPGVPGIGVKTAAELITNYGDLESLLAAAGSIKQPKRRERLIEFAEQARISRELVRLKEDVPVEVPAEQFGIQDPQAETLLAFLRKMEFTTLTKRIAEKLGVEVPAVAAVSPPAGKGTEGENTAAAGVASSSAFSQGGREAPSKEIEQLQDTHGPGTPAAGAAIVSARVANVPFDRSAYETVTGLDRLAWWIAAARDAGRFAIDIETTALDCMNCDLVGFSMAVAPGKACYVPVGHRPAEGGFDFGDGGGLPQAPLAETLALIKPLLEDAAILKIGHNIKFDMLVLKRYGIELAPIDDTMLISYVLDCGRWGHGMDTLAERHLSYTCLSFDKVLELAPGKKGEKNFAQVPIEKAAAYAAEDADVTLRLWMKLKPRLAAERLATVYETLERPLVPVIAGMEHNGILVDKGVLSRLSSTFAQSLTRLEEEINGLVGHKFNLGSPKQLGELLFDRLKLPGGKRTKSGQWETRAGLLDDLAANEDVPESARGLINKMLEWRQLSKLLSTYTDALPAFIHGETGRIHTSYALASTTTGRLASSDPNLQNIPIRTKEGREIRTAFIADAGNVLVSADYSQIELRVLAHIADIPQLKGAFADGLDIHAMTASEMFGVPIQGMPPEVRRRAKAINFGIIYGISAFGLANQLGISREEAGAYIKTYFERFPGIRDYMDATKKRAHDVGFVETIFGRRIHYPEINTRNPGVRGNLERAAINAPIQGSAADILRRAMVRMGPALESARLETARMLLQVHDELVFEVAQHEAETLIT
ncbi:DNA polymerase I, partial [Hyphomicrobium sp.]|uniref:DNA polymerase I n=1 Tax=Hyphomicrobium sp. TaxID=82 RepID=UPI002FDD0EF1